MQDKVRLKDLAQQLNTSITTVSKALNGHPDISEATRKRIVDYAASVNYIPNQVARNFRQQRSNTVGIILSDNSNAYNSRMIRGMEEVLTARGYYPFFMDSHEDLQTELSLIRQLRALNVAGVLMTPVSNQRQSCDLLNSFHIPYVLTRRLIDEGENPYVIVDDFSCAYLSMKYLSTYGHEQIFFLNALQELPSARNRLAGFRKALQDLQIPEQPHWVIPNCMNQQDGYLMMRQLLKNYTPPFSVLCFNDHIAVGVICALQERKIQIPFDVAVMGTDNIELLSYVKPRLTTIDLPKKRLGQRAAELLLDLIEAEEDPLAYGKIEKHVVFKPRLIIRETA